MKRLYRSQRDKKLFGLCGGLAEMLNVDATLIRLIAVIVTVFSSGTFFFVYIVASLVVPKEPYAEGPSYHGYYGQQGGYKSQYHEPPKAEPNLDKMMDDIERKAMQKEIEELRARMAKYEKGDV